VDIIISTAQKVLFQSNKGENEKMPIATGVLCKSGAIAGKNETKVQRVFAQRKVILCCGAIESPILLMKSGCGPVSKLRKIDQLNNGKELKCGDVIIANEYIGTNLQDHWVKRAEAKVPERYSYPLLYPRILGYKHRFQDIAVGFGKLQLAGKNLISIATATCKNPGQIVFHEGKLQPKLSVGPNDVETYEKCFAELKRSLGGIGIQLIEKKKPFSPNWHLSCTLSIGTCVDDNLKLIGAENLYCSDVSVLKNIIPMNTQIVSYFIPYALVSAEE